MSRSRVYTEPPAPPTVAWVEIPCGKADAKRYTAPPKMFPPGALLSFTTGPDARFVHRRILAALLRDAKETIERAEPLIDKMLAIGPVADAYAKGEITEAAFKEAMQEYQEIGQIKA